MNNQGSGGQLPMDEKWFTRYKALANVPSYLLKWGPNLINEKQSFLRGDTRNPKLEYFKPEAEDLARRHKGLEKLESDIVRDEPNKAVGSVYGWRIKSEQKKISMHEALASGNEAEFLSLAGEIYGRPESKYYLVCANHLRGLTELSLKSNNGELVTAASDLHQELVKNFDSASNIDLVPDEVAGLWDYSLPIKKKYLDFVDSIPVKKVFKAEGIIAIFKEALKVINANEWSVIVGEGNSIWVDEENSSVIVPATRILDIVELKQIVIHEIFSHVLRRKNGEKTKLRILNIGLNGYLKFEEGLSVIRSQAIQEENSPFSGLSGYLSNSWALGLDGNKRDFRDVFIILRLYYKFFLAYKLSDDLMNEQVIDDLAWSKTVRTFLGTDGLSKGVAFTKGVMYFNGMKAVKKISEEYPREVNRFISCKYNAADERHRWALDELGITGE